MPGPMIGPLFTRSLLADHDDKSDWIIKPDQLILHAPTQRKLIKPDQLILHAPTQRKLIM